MHVPSLVCNPIQQRIRTRHKVVVGPSPSTTTSKESKQLKVPFECDV